MLFLRIAVTIMNASYRLLEDDVNSIGYTNVFSSENRELLDRVVVLETMHTLEIDMASRYTELIHLPLKVPALKGDNSPTITLSQGDVSQAISLAAEFPESEIALLVPGNPNGIGYRFMSALTPFEKDVFESGTLYPILLRLSGLYKQACTSLNKILFIPDVWFSSHDYVNVIVQPRVVPETCAEDRFRAVLGFLNERRIDTLILDPLDWGIVSQDDSTKLNTFVNAISSVSLAKHIICLCSSQDIFNNLYTFLNH